MFPLNNLVENWRIIRKSHCYIDFWSVHLSFSLSFILVWHNIILTEYGVFSSQTTKDPLKYSLLNSGAELIWFQTRMNDKLSTRLLISGSWVRVPRYEPFVTGEKLWLDRGSNPGPFADHANTLPLSYRATRSSHQQLFTWTLPGYNSVYKHHFNRWKNNFGKKKYINISISPTKFHLSHLWRIIIQLFQLWRVVIVANYITDYVRV